MPQDKKKQEGLPPGFVDPFKKEEELPPGFIDPRKTPQENVSEMVKERIKQDVLSIPGVQSTISTLSPVLDFVSRPSYASARFADALADDSKGILDAIGESWDELTGTEAAGTRKKISYSDFIKRRFPEFALENPTATTALGFVGDVALDPLSYLGVGLAKSGVSVGARTLTRSTREAVTGALATASKKVFVGKNGTLELVESFPKAVAKAERVEKTAKAFEQRLANTKVTNFDGTPKIVYHGTEATDFKRFKTSGDIEGTFFTENPDVAATFAKEGQTIPVYLNIKKPLNYDDVVPTDIANVARRLGMPITGNEKTVDVIGEMRLFLDPDPLKGQQKAIQQVKRLGYDGIEVSSLDNGIVNKQYIAFNPNQIINALSGKGVVARANVLNKSGAIGNKLDIENQLTKQGYFDAVREKGNEIEKFINDLTGSPNVDVAQTLAKSETLQDLKRVARNRLPDEMFSDEVRERIHQRMDYLTKLDPKLSQKFFEPKGVYLKAGVPFGPQKDLVRIVGLERITNKVRALSTYIEAIPKVGPAITKVGRTIGETFSRNFGLPEEYIKFRDELENELGYLSDEMIRNTRKLFSNFKKDERERIGEAMNWVDGETRKLEDIRANSSDPSFRTLTDGEAAQITQEGLDRFNLSAEARALVATMQQSYKEAALLEMRAGLLKNNLINYSPRGYDVIENPDDMSLITRGKIAPVPQPYLSSSNTRKFNTMQEAIDAGFQPELDAAMLYAHRVLSSKRALAIQHFKESVTEIFGAYTPKSKIAHTGILPTAVISTNLPARIVDDMKMIGEAVYPSGTNQTLKQWIRVFDFAQKKFKQGATTIRPSFAPKQLLSNTVQAALIVGIKAFRALDPRVVADAAILMARGGRPLNNLPPFLTNFISKHFTGNEGLDAILASRTVLARHFGEEQLNSFTRQYKLRTALGQEYTGDELVQLARENGVIRGFDSTGESFSTKLQDELSKDQNSYKNVVGVLSKVWNHASMVEDYGRMSLFINGIRMGYSAKDSVKLVNKALFDYQRGLSAIEKSWIRRLIPFYSFQRFAIPFVLKNTLSKPNSFATMEKLMGTMEKLFISGEELNDGEVNIFNEKGNNYLLEQPRLLSGFDDKGAATLNILNNLTPYDVLNMMVYDKEGNVDINRTMEKTFAAAITPFIKVPLEALWQRDFFTGKTIDQASKLGNIEGSLGKVIPQFAKDLMGWEVATNKVTGKTSVYVNPFLSYYSMQFIPALRDIVKAQEDVEYDSLMGPVQAAMNLIYEAGSPVKQKGVDLLEFNQRSFLQRNKDIEDIKSGLLRAKIEGRDSKFADDLDKLQRFIGIIGKNAKDRAGFNIRGQGIVQKQIPGQEGITEVPEQPTPEQIFK